MDASEGGFVDELVDAEGFVGEDELEASRESRGPVPDLVAEPGHRRLHQARQARTALCREESSILRGTEANAHSEG